MRHNKPEHPNPLALHTESNNKSSVITRQVRLLDTPVCVAVVRRHRPNPKRSAWNPPPVEHSGGEANAHYSHETYQYYKISRLRKGKDE